MQTNNDVLVVVDDPTVLAVLRLAFALIAPEANLRVTKSWTDVRELVGTEPPPRLAIVETAPGRCARTDFVRWLREHPVASGTPVVVVGNDDLDELQAAYDAGADAFITRPGGLVAFDDVQRRLHAFWLGTAARIETCLSATAAIAHQA